MNESISVDEAIKKGIYRVNLPALLIFIIGLVVSFSIAFIFFMPYVMIFGLVLSYVLATVYRSIMAAKWRIWAFTNVRNVHELHIRALTERLLFLTSRPGFGVINYNSESQKEQWAQLQGKFDQPDIFFDDSSVPAETVIHYSLLKIIIWAIVYLLMTSFGIYLCTLGRVVSYIIGIPLGGIGAINTYRKLKAIFNRKPQITINNEGLGTTATPFYKWSEIVNEQAIREGTGKYAMYYLCYDQPNGSTKFHLDNFDTNLRQLQKLLQLYRGRSDQAKL